MIIATYPRSCRRNKRVLKILSCILLYVLLKLAVVQIIVGVGFGREGVSVQKEGIQQD
jgi:hypothetical protein